MAGISAADLVFRAWTKLNVNASGDALLPAGNYRIMCVVCTAAAAAAAFVLFNNTTQAGTDTISVSAPIGQTCSTYLGTNGTRFNVGISGTISGAGAKAEVYYVKED